MSSHLIHTNITGKGGLSALADDAFLYFFTDVKNEDSWLHNASHTLSDLRSDAASPFILLHSLFRE